MIFCFNKYSKISINILALLICCLIFASIIGLKSIFVKINIENKNDESFIIKNDFEENLVDDFSNNIEDDISLSEDTSEIKYEWFLKIPKINLYAEISEGTDDETLNKYIGHFDESKKESGNVCLAAHNRGYDVNYFSELNKLEIDDEIIYYINGNQYVYKVNEILVIYETDWTVIENTEEDIITLITCIENRPAYRLCVRGIREE